MSALVVALAIACVGAMAAIVAIDLKQRRIPRQLCWTIAACGGALQLVVCGKDSLFEGIAVGFAVVVACLVAKRMLGEDSIGGGDVRCMAALSMATGWGAPVGFTACFASAAAWSLAKKLRNRARPGDSFAFAPFLATWLVVGGIACLC